MKFNPIFLYKENDLNKILRKHKGTDTSFGLLYTSLWDSLSGDLVSKIKEESPDETRPPLYVLDSFHMPHSTVIYGVSDLPTLVLHRRNKVLTERWLSNIYTTIGL